MHCDINWAIGLYFEAYVVCQKIAQSIAARKPNGFDFIFLACEG